MLAEGRKVTVAPLILYEGWGRTLCSSRSSHFLEHMPSYSLEVSR